MRMSDESNHAGPGMIHFRGEKRGTARSPSAVAWPCLMSRQLSGLVCTAFPSAAARSEKEWKECPSTRPTRTSAPPEKRNHSVLVPTQHSDFVLRRFELTLLQLP